jgi:hypothetical protein
MLVTICAGNSHEHNQYASVLQSTGDTQLGAIHEEMTKFMQSVSEYKLLFFIVCRHYAK